MIRGFLLALALATSLPAGSAPTHYLPVFGSAILCRDKIEPAYLKGYLSTHFKKPYKTEGGAYWFKPDSTTLFDMNVTELFVSTEDNERYVFVGAILLDTPKGAREKISAFGGPDYIPYPDDNTLRSGLGGFIVKYTVNQIKVYCVKERVPR